MTIAIYTPTFNRREKLKSLYYSLCQQTFKDFFWLIIDDGSNDGTEKQVFEWQEQSIINIKYIKKKNGGKHTAVNIALNIVDNYWNICIDSDDIFISKYSLQNIQNDITNYGIDKKIVSIVYPLQLLGKDIKNINRIPKTIIDSDARNKKNNVTEVSIVSRPKAYKNIRFPEFKNEYFISEGSIEIPKLYKGKRIYINNPIITGEYLENGLTNNILNIWKNNPKGYYYARNVSAKYYIEKKKYLKMMKPLGQMIAFNCSTRKKLMNGIDNKAMAFFSIPLGVLFWQKKLK